MNYESFMLAVWIWNYMTDTSLAEKRKIVKTLRSQPLTVWEYVKHSKPSFPPPTDEIWKECIKATGFPALESDDLSSSELSDDIKTKLNLEGS